METASFKRGGIGIDSMKSYSVRFRFSQHFDFPAEVAYKWCTDYRPDDIVLQGNVGQRKVNRVNDDTLILTDTSLKDGKTVTKRKLVRLYPETHSWTNTRISEEGRHSQFLYAIHPEKGGSRLDFTGSQVFAGKKPSAARLATMAAKMVDEDSRVWRNLAKAMAKDLSG